MIILLASNLSGLTVSGMIAETTASAVVVDDEASGGHVGVGVGLAAAVTLVIVVAAGVFDRDCRPLLRGGGAVTSSVTDAEVEGAATTAG